MQNTLPAIQFSLFFMMLFHLTFWKGVFSFRVLLTFSATGESYHGFNLLSEKQYTGVSILYPWGSPGGNKIKLDVLQVNICLKVLKRFYLSSRCGWHVCFYNEKPQNILCYDLLAAKGLRSCLETDSFDSQVSKFLIDTAVSPAVKPEGSAKIHGKKHLLSGRDLLSISGEWSSCIWMIAGITSQ